MRRSGARRRARVVARLVVGVLVGGPILATISFFFVGQREEARANTVTTTYTSGTTWTVPYGVSSITVTARGGAGGRGGLDC